jgi:hypothetical protein
MMRMAAGCPLQLALFLAPILLLAGSATAADPALAPTTQPAWSAPVNGLRACISLKPSEVLNGTLFIVPYLHLQNVSDVGNAMSFPWKNARLTARIVDADGKQLEGFRGPRSGPMALKVDLILPFHGELSFDISTRGSGIPANQQALIDMGFDHTWALPRDGKAYTLQVALEVPDQRDLREEGTWRWHGKIDLPAVAVPSKPAAAAPGLEQQINDLGAQLLSRNSSEAEAAQRALSLIDDPRVIPWYLKALDTRDYSMKFAALDRLASFKEDAALEGLKKGCATRGQDIASASTPELAADLANNIRNKAAQALATSPHPDGKKLLMTLASDPYYGVRLTVLHTVNSLNTPEAAALVQSLTADPDSTVRNEALRYMQGGTPPAR